MSLWGKIAEEVIIKSLLIEAHLHTQADGGRKFFTACRTTYLSDPFFKNNTQKISEFLSYGKQ